MKYKGHNPRVDANQPVIVKELRQRGAMVIVIGQPVDLLVGYKEQWALVELKSGKKGKVTPKQQDFLEQCAGHNVPCFILDDLDDVETFFPISGQQ